MNRRGFVATVMGAITAGLSRPWWERGVELHSAGAHGFPPSVLTLPTKEPIQHLYVVNGVLYAFTETEIWVVYLDQTIHQRASWGSASADWQWTAGDRAARRTSGRPMLDASGWAGLPQ